MIFVDPRSRGLQLSAVILPIPVPRLSTLLACHQDHWRPTTERLEGVMEENIEKVLARFMGGKKVLQCVH